MDPLVFAAVLGAALCHAGWNAVIKAGTDPLVTTAVVTIAAGLVGAALVPIVGFPAVASLPWLIASIVVHLLYFAALIEAYRHGDLSQVYPIARGSAPLMTATITTTFIGERLGTFGWIGLLLLVIGVFLLSLRGGSDALARFNRRGVAYALATAVTICAYSVVDGIGARAAGNPTAYSAMLFVGGAVVMLAYVVARRGFGAFVGTAPVWRTGLIGGAMQIGSYGIVIWAMTLAPIAIIAALRETSVLFGALIAVVVLKEPLNASRVIAALAVVAGLVLLRLA